jgi:hypothetical protein
MPLGHDPAQHGSREIPDGSAYQSIRLCWPRPTSDGAERRCVTAHVTSSDPHLLQGIDTEEIIATVHASRAPMMSATAGPRL